MSSSIFKHTYESKLIKSFKYQNHYTLMFLVSLNVNELPGVEIMTSFLYCRCSKMTRCPEIELNKMSSKSDKNHFVILLQQSY